MKRPWKTFGKRLQSQLLLLVWASHWPDSCMWLMDTNQSTVVLHVTHAKEWREAPEIVPADAFLLTGNCHPAVRTAAALTATRIAAAAARDSYWLHLPPLPLWIFRASCNTGFFCTLIISGWNNVPGSEGSIPGKGTWPWMLAYGQIFLLWSRNPCDSFINGQHARVDCHLILCRAGHVSSKV